MNAPPVEAPPVEAPPVEAPPLEAPSASTTHEGLASGSKRKTKRTGKDNKSKSKGKGKETEQARIPGKDTDPLPSDMNLLRVVWIRIHPAAFDDVLASLQTAASFALRTVKRHLKLRENRTFEVEIADLRGQLNAFEIMGPKSSQVIQGALVPVDDQREEFKKVQSPNLIPVYSLTCFFCPSISSGHPSPIYRQQAQCLVAW